MALILNLETATTVCSVSVAKDGKLLALKEQNGNYAHAENLTLFIQDVLRQAKVSLSDIDAVAVSKGPGSYTGLRIGVSTAKGLCYSLNKPLLSVNTLEHMSLSVTGDRIMTGDPTSTALYCPMIDARRMEVYCALYDITNKCKQPTSALIIDEFSFKEFLSPINQSGEGHLIYFFGDGSMKCKSVLSQNKNAIFIDTIFPSAKNMISLSEKAFNNKEFEDLAYFEPFYLKDFVAGKKTRS